MSRVDRAKRVASYVVILAVAGLVLYPMALMFLSALRTSPDLMRDPVGLPDSLTLSNFADAWTRGGFAGLVANSAIVTIGALICLTTIGTMAAWALRQSFRRSGQLLAFFLVGEMIPIQTIIVPLFILERQLGLISTFPGLILAYSAFYLPLAILIFSRFFQTIPRELEEAAIVDGASHMQAFRMIVLPLSRPAIASVVTITGVMIWNDFFLPLVLMLESSRYTLAVGLIRLRGEFATDLPQFYAAMVMLSLPVLLVFVFLQGSFIRGMTEGAVKA